MHKLCKLRAQASSPSQGETLTVLGMHAWPEEACSLAMEAIKPIRWGARRPSSSQGDMAGQVPPQVKLKWQGEHAVQVNLMPCSSPERSSSEASVVLQAVRGLLPSWLRKWLAAS